MTYADPVSSVRIRAVTAQVRGRRGPVRARPQTEVRARALAALRCARRLGALRDRAWELSVPYSTLRRWVARDPELVARIARERRATRR